ncbi:hypothetical protein Tco_0266462 [Tanacetum coccineum]
MHRKETTSNSVETPKPEIKVYSRRPKQIKSIGCPDCSIVSGLQMFKTYDRESLSAHELHQLFLGTIRFGNDQVAKIMRYGDYQLGNVIILRVYYVEGLGHNLFFGQFCDADHVCLFIGKHLLCIQNLEGV